MNSRTFPVGFILSAALALASIQTEAEVAYRIQRIDFPEGSSASDLNNKGEVVGTGSAFVEERQIAVPLLWRKGRTIDLTRKIGRAGDSISLSGINDRSTISGTIFEPSTMTGFIFKLPRRRIDVAPQTTGEGINNRNHVFGTVFNEDGTQDLYLWRRGELTRLPFLPGGEAGAALGMNDHGDVVGHSGPVGPLPVVWREGTVMPLPVLDGTDSGQAHSINNSGQVVGVNMIGGSFPLRGFLWTGESLLELLAPEAECTSVSPVAINNWGVVIGDAGECARGDAVATIWLATKPVALDDVIATADPLRTQLRLRTTIAINDRGQILATGTDRATGTEHHFVLLTPTYRPGALKTSAVR
jgi:uncharacterized membrane protein